MGRIARPKPGRLGEKLLKIRNSLGLSQDQMLARLGLSKGLYRSAVSGYELGTREPPLRVLLTYAEIAGVWVDALIDDELELPENLPANQRRKLQS
ncbi:MAG TPA: helix-turn-helix transcriptional regulator [Blastocatellia bacterium]